MKKHIILSGGLGNQMFQYALYLSCKKKGINIILNRDMYEVNRMHNGYMLNKAFKISDSELSKTSRISVFVTRFIRRYLPPGIIYNENPDLFSDNVYKTVCPYINGVFMGERYFKENMQDIRSAFSFQNIDSYNIFIAQKISNENSVSVHVRRGDYLNSPQYAICLEEYYIKAIKLIQELVPNPKFYVFSDDSEWCDAFFRGFNFKYEIINHNSGIDCYKDMYLMTQCKHNIIANSTFSWWGAWLNSNKNKIVVCPSFWIKGRNYNPCLHNWIHID